MTAITQAQRIVQQGRIPLEALAAWPTADKNRALKAMAETLLANEARIVAANALDVDAGRASGLSDALIDRLTLTPARIQGMAQAILEVAAFPDPVGEVLSGWTADKGIEISKVRVPIGLLLMIYEARPNVTADAAALALKSGNAIILKGGKEANHSNAILAELLIEAGEKAGMPKNAVQLFVPEAGESLIEMMGMADAIDAIIPRGGAGLKAFIKTHAKAPIIMTGEGNCHIFVDADAQPEKTIEIVLNAKTQRPGVCNAIETLLIHEAYPETARKALLDALMQAGVQLVGCAALHNVMPGIPQATEADWETEYLQLKLAVKLVPDLQAAVAHINTYGSGHSESILSESYKNCEYFLKHVDAAVVYANASTRFTDGGVFGFGGEIGISTQKLHARGPMGVRELTATKYLVRGQGQVRG